MLLMKLYSPRLILIALCIGAIYPQLSFAQGSGVAVGIGGKVSTLGIGAEGALAVTESGNVRVGFNIFNYSRTFSKSGINYNGELDLRSFQITYDQYLISGLHISPSLLAYNGTHVDATAAVPAGQSFSLGGTTYFSGQTNPINGTGTATARKVAPAILLGFGNLVPRSGKHLGVNFDAGVVFQGSPTTKLNLTGSACVVNSTTACLNAGTDPTVQANVHKEEAQLNKNLEPIKYFPVVSIGVSWKW
jgi:hypothetical protein